MKTLIDKILKEKQEKKLKLKELNKQMIDIERKLPYHLLIKFHHIQKEIITLQKAITDDNHAIRDFEKRVMK